MRTITSSRPIHPLAPNVYSSEEVSSREFVQLDYRVVTHFILVYSCGFVSYSHHDNELRFALRFIATKGELQWPFDAKKPTGPTIGDEQRAMMDWLGSSAHGNAEFWNEDEGRPTDIQLQAMFYGFSGDSPERIRQWLDNVLAIDEGFLSRRDKVERATQWLEDMLHKKTARRL